MRRLLPLFGWVLALPVAAVVWAAGGGFVVDQAATRLVDEVYHLEAHISLQFTPAVREALDSGVPLTLELDIEAVHPRKWLWSETVASLSQRYRLRYHALSGQYLVTNLNSNVQSSYGTLRAALRAIGTVDDLPILDRRLLKVGEHYDGRLRVQLDLGALPSPLRVWAQVSSDWRLSSDWYTWSLQ